MMTFRYFNRLLLALGLLTTFCLHPLVVQRAFPTAQAQSSTPTECVDDSGQPVLPRATHYWALVLNFNHAPSSEMTVGCIVTYENDGRLLRHQIIDCPLKNNRHAVKVGNGAAPFDSFFWIECEPPKTAAPSANFYIEATATFPTIAHYPIIDHPSVKFDALVDVDWRVTLTSHYGRESFQQTDRATSVRYRDVVLVSNVAEQRGLHFVDGTRLGPPIPIGKFVFDDSQPLQIGKGSPKWLLHELIVDPRGICC